MNQSYSNSKLYEIASENYKNLVQYCNLLYNEGYWDKPETILKKNIYEVLDLYVQATLVRLALYDGTMDYEERNFIRTIPACNVLEIPAEGTLDDDLFDQTKHIVDAPPIIIQLCGLRDSERKSNIASIFFDSLLNILLAMSYLNGARDGYLVPFIVEYYKKVSAFIQPRTNIKKVEAFPKTELLEMKYDDRKRENSFNKWVDTETYMDNEKDEDWSQYFQTILRNRQNKKTSTLSDQDKKLSNKKLSNRTKLLKEEQSREFIEDINNRINNKRSEEINNKRNEENINKRNEEINDNRNREFRLNKNEEQNNEKLDLKKISNCNNERNNEENKELNNKGNEELKNEIDDKIKDEIEAQNSIHNLEELLGELNSLIGLVGVKEEINSLINLIKVRKLRENYNMPLMDMSYHMVFTGNPGTGKTTVARLIAKIYKELGLLSEGNFIETDRSGLVAGYVGQTAIKVKEIVEKAIGGVLFIDEAYSLSSGGGTNDFGGEAIDTLVKMMEDNRDNLVVIVAGYNEEMQGFLKSNTGLISRFNKFIDFPDYSIDELIDILNKNASKNSISIDPLALDVIRKNISTMSEEKFKEFGNARGIRNVFEKIVVNQANRIVTYENPTMEQLQEVMVDDVINIII